MKRKKRRKPEPEPPLTRAEVFAHTSFGELEREVLTPNGWTEVARMTLSEDYPARYLRLYAHEDHDRGGLIAVKTKPKKGTPFVVFYRETKNAERRRPK